MSVVKLGIVKKALKTKDVAGELVVMLRLAALEGLRYILRA